MTEEALGGEEGGVELEPDSPEVMEAMEQAAISGTPEAIAANEAAIEEGEIQEAITQAVTPGTPEYEASIEIVLQAEGV